MMKAGSNLRLSISIVLERVHDLHRHADPRLDGLEERGDLRGAAREVDLGEVRVGRGARVEVERALDLAGHLLGDAGHHPLDLLRHDRVRVAAPAADLQRLGLFVGDVELLLDLFGELVAADGHVAGERRSCRCEMMLMFTTEAPALISTTVSFSGTS